MQSDAAAFTTVTNDKMHSKPTKIVAVYDLFMISQLKLYSPTLIFNF